MQGRVRDSLPLEHMYFKPSKPTLLPQQSQFQTLTMTFLEAIFPCLPISRREYNIQLPTGTAKYQHNSEKAALQDSPHGRGGEQQLRCDEASSSIVTAMMEANSAGPSLDVTIKSLVHQAGGWSEYLAKRILLTLEAVLKSGKQMNTAMQKAYGKACEAARMIEGFAEDHPVATAVFCTVIALGILVLLAPYALELLGFSELGPVEGKSCSSRSFAV